MKRFTLTFAATVLLVAACVIPLNDGGDGVGLTSKPPAPAGLTATVLSASSVGLSWQAAAGATSYKVWRGSSAGGTGTELASVNSAAYTDSTVTLGGDYYYRVSAVNKHGESEKSEAACGSVKAPAAPTGLAAAAESKTSVVVTWNAAEGASGYTLYCAADSGAFDKLASVQATTYRHANVNGDFKYSYKVAASNIVGESAPSAAVQVVFMVPTAPTGLAATALSDTSIEVTWDAVPGAVMYKVYRGSTALTSVTGTSYVNSGLAPFSSYSYNVAAVNNIGEGPKTSASVSRYTQPVPLQDRVWHNMSESRNYSDCKYYSFPVSGGSYSIQWGNVGHTAEANSFINVSAYWVGSNSMESLTTPLFEEKQNGLANPQKITPASSGYVVLRVRTYSAVGDIRFYKE